MQKNRTLRAVLLVLAIALVAASCSGRDDASEGGSSSGSDGGSDTAASDKGVVDTADCPDTATAGIDKEKGTITIASSFPQSDPLLKAFAQISKGWKAYFEKLNKEGGVEIDGKKYKILTIDKDDNYDENRTAENINSMLGEDGTGAFAVFNVVGTANNENIREDLGDLCVPNVFAATGSPSWGNPDFPWTIGSTLAPYTLETKAFADYLAKEYPDAKVGMLVQDDDFGKAYEEGFKSAIKDTDITVTKVESYKAGTNDVDAQVTSLAGSGANVFFNGATLLACPNALKAANTSGWKRDATFVSGTCISKTLMGIAGADADGVLATTNIKDPLNPAFADDAAMKEYKATIDEFGADDVDVENGIVAYGYTQAALFAKVLGSLDELSRPALMNKMYDLDGVTGGLLLDDVTVTTSEDDRYLAENLQLIQYDSDNKYFENIGEVIDFEGKTADLTPKELIGG